MSVPIYSSETRIAKLSEQEMADYIVGLKAFAGVKPLAIGRINRSLDIVAEVAQEGGLDSLAIQAQAAKIVVASAALKSS